MGSGAGAGCGAGVGAGAPPFWRCCQPAGAYRSFSTSGFRSVAGGEAGVAGVLDWEGAGVRLRITLNSVEKRHESPVHLV